MVSELLTGSVFAGYRIEGVIGRGGMGVVYRAIQLELGREVALKLLAPSLGQDPDFRERFKREAQMAASIDHPNVIPIYEVGEVDGRLYIAMRYVAGTDLQRLIADEGRLSADRAVGIVEQLAAALDAAHARGLVHRDVKPANVMLTAGDQEHVYLADFGLTRHAAAEPSLTSAGQFVGTPDYAAPEQVKGGRLDARTDTYALGGVLFHALAGRVPYPVRGRAAKFRAHRKEPPPVLSAAVADLPAPLEGVIERAMAKDPTARYLSAGDMARAARAALVGDPLPKPEGSVAKGDAAPPRTITALARLPSRWGGAIRLAALVAVVSGAVTSLVVLASGPGEGQSEQPRVGTISGKQIVFVRSPQKRGSEPEIYTTSADGSREVRLTSNRFGDVEPSVSRDGKKIAFTRYRNRKDPYNENAADHHIYVMNSDGSDQRRLTKGAADDAGPLFSPDGKKIAWVRGVKDGAPGPPTAIGVMDADGTNRKLRTDYRAFYHGISFSPDSRKIAFVRERVARRLKGKVQLEVGIYLMNADGSSTTDLTKRPSRPGYYGETAFSPDGKKIAFTLKDPQKGGSRGGPASIYMMNTDGSGKKRLTYSRYGDFKPVFSPDATKIAFSRLGKSGYHEIYVVTTDGAQVKRLTHDPSHDRYPVFSPDGKRIAFTSDRDGVGNEEIYVMNADGTDETRLTNNPATDSAPQWRYATR